MGRPKLDAGDRRDKRVPVIVTADERELMREAAKLSRKTPEKMLAVWARETLLRAARAAVKRAEKGGG